jgi:hypothetical protein
MTREQFLDLVRHPENAASLSSESVSALVNQFPYCQPLRYLYLRQLADQDSIHYPQQLKITAAFSPDRTRLFRLIHPVPVMAGSEEDNNGYSSPLGLSENQQSEAASSEMIVDEPSYLLPDPDDEIAESPVIFESVKEEDLPDTSSSVSVEEELLSPQDIVMQRLKELNLWKDENDAAPYTVSVPAYEEPVQEVPLEVTIEEQDEPVAETATIIQENITASIQEETITPVSAPEETLIIQVPSELPGMEIPEVPVVTEQEVLEEIKPVAEAAPTEPDPLDTLIKESLVETRLRNSEYFDDQLLQDIQSEQEPVADQPQELHIEEIPVSFTGHKQEIHSFTDWLRINKPSEETATSENPLEDHPSAETDNTPEPTPIVATNVSDEHPPIPQEIPVPEAAAPIHQQSVVEAPKPAASIKPISTGRIVYVKPGNQETLPSIAAVRHEPEAPAPTAAPVIHHETPAPQAPTAPAEPRINQEHLISDANTEFIPQRRPIPDPSLVDTDPPRPKVPSRDLIDKFIREEPRITPSKSTFYSPANMAKKSVVEPEDLITETLANIYAQQGNFQKAIHFYEKLSLKFPEKSRYFAALIDELKKKSNS